jgi:hypothetical protein
MLRPFIHGRFRLQTDAGANHLFYTRYTFRSEGAFRPRKPEIRHPQGGHMASVTTNTITSEWNLLLR